MKFHSSIVLALGAIMIVGCHGNADDTTSTASTASTTGATADIKKPATAPASEVAGTWTSPDQGTLVFGDDKSFTLTNSDKSMGGEMTISGTYELGAASKYLTGGKELSMKVTDLAMKATDPTKQADMDKQKATLMPMIAKAMADNAEKLDSATEMEIQGVGEKTPRKWTKKS